MYGYSKYHIDCGEHSYEINNNFPPLKIYVIIWIDLYKFHETQNIYITKRTLFPKYLLFMFLEALFH